MTKRTKMMRRQFQNFLAVLCATLIAAGCGVGQAVTDNTVAAAKWAFTTQVKTMNIDLTSRSSLNTNGGGKSLSTVVRIYQLKTPQAFEQLSYEQFQADDLDGLKPDLLAELDVLLRPDAVASISESMKDEAQYVGVVALFRDSGKSAEWKLLIPKKQWKSTDPVKIVANDNVLELVGAKPEPVKAQAPLHSTPKPRQQVSNADIHPD
jgi:type VI secretion system protein VasD